MAEHVEVSCELGGTRVAVLRKNIEQGDSLDANFFDESYTVAGSTGFLVWEGSLALLSILQRELASSSGGGDNSGPVSALLRGRRVLELGSGTGLLGLAVAAGLGARVLLTDLPPVVTDVLAPNIARNAASATTSATAPATALAATAWVAGCGGGVAVGSQGGAASCLALDWTRSVEAQCSGSAAWDVTQTEVILAAETVWLQELVEPFVATVTALMRFCSQSSGSGSCKRPACLLVFRERAVASSETFASAKALLDCFAAHNVFPTTILEQPSAQSSEHMVRVLSLTLPE